MIMLELSDPVQCRVITNLTENIGRREYYNALDPDDSL